jgi:hypothetical protein
MHKLKVKHAKLTEYPDQNQSAAQDVEDVGFSVPTLHIVVGKECNVEALPKLVYSMRFRLKYAPCFSDKLPLEGHSLRSFGAGTCLELVEEMLGSFVEPTV